MYLSRYCRYLNEVELKQSEFILISSKTDENDHILSLTLDKLKLINAGRVQVVANNSEGDVGSSAMLTVRGTECFFLIDTFRGKIFNRK